MATDGYFELNPWIRKVTTANPQAQIWFDRGLNWTYGYNQEEGVTCFRKALEHDPDCAMAWWGIAYAHGPFYNRPWIRFTRREVEETLPVCHEAAARAVTLSEGCTPAERSLIDAIIRRYPVGEWAPLEDLDQWHRDFTDAMRAAHLAHPDDLDIAALYVEAAVTRTPRKFWNLQTGEPVPGTDILEGIAILERAMAQNRADGGPLNPGVLHMYIHAVEMSPYPHKALQAADALRDLAVSEGHLHHMPAHVYVLCGDYAQSIDASHRAIAVNDRYLDYAGLANFYSTSHCHDLHLLMYASMFQGVWSEAIFAADRIGALATPELVSDSFPYMATILDGYSAMRSHVQVRFGRWRELTLEAPPEHPELMPIRGVMHAYGQAIAHAALGEIEEATAARRAFDAARGRVPEDSWVLSNWTHDILAVGDAMIEGELEYRKGNYETAFRALRRAVECDDGLNYTEPWAWMHPPRHALAALLAEQGHFGEAEAVLRADLGYDPSLARCSHHPDNVWALHGLLECVRQSGRDGGEAAMLRQRLDFAQARSDVAITASCACRGMG